MGRLPRCLDSKDEETYREMHLQNKGQESKLCAQVKRGPHKSEDILHIALCKGGEMSHFLFPCYLLVLHLNAFLHSMQSPFLLSQSTETRNEGEKFPAMSAEFHVQYFVVKVCVKRLVRLLKAVTMPKTNVLNMLVMLTQ